MRKIKESAFISVTDYLLKQTECDFSRGRDINEVDLDFKKDEPRIGDLI